VKKWRELLGNKKPTHSYKPQKLTNIIATSKYYDNELQRIVNKDELLIVPERRATMICNAGYGRRA